jgi:hypothetical protein
LASPGNGPLIELATLVEYAARLEPSTVLWLYFEGNDLRNLTGEMSSDTLRWYLDGDFSHRLQARQPEIDARSRELSDQWEAVARSEEDRAWMTQLGALATLYHVRHLLGWTTPSIDWDRAAERFCEVVQRAKFVAGRWGGRTVFVYLPS